MTKGTSTPEGKPTGKVFDISMVRDLTVSTVGVRQLASQPIDPDTVPKEDFRNTPMRGMQDIGGRFYSCYYKRSLWWWKGGGSRMHRASLGFDGSYRRILRNCRTLYIFVKSKSVPGNVATVRWLHVLEG